MKNILTRLLLLLLLPLPAFGQIQGLGTGAVSVGVTDTDCSAHPFTVLHIKGSCTFFYSGNPIAKSYVVNVDGDYNLYPNVFSGIFNVSIGIGTIYAARVDSLVISPYSGFGQPWSPYTVCGLQGSVQSGITALPYGRPGYGPNIIKVVKAGPDGFGPSGMGCDTVQTLQNPAYTNRTGYVQKVTGLPGQTSPLYLQPGQFLPLEQVPLGTSWGFSAVNLNPNASGINPDTGLAYNSDFAVVGGLATLQNGTDINGLPPDGASASLLASGNSGAINWDNGTGGAGAQDSTLKAGFNQLVNSDNQLLEKLGVIANNTAGGSGGSSGGGSTNIINVNPTVNVSNAVNLTVNVTNINGGISNNISITNSIAAWTNGITSNQLAGIGWSIQGQVGQNFTNGSYAKILAATNAAGALAANGIIGVASDKWSGSLAADAVGGGTTRDVEFAPGVLMTISTQNFPVAYGMLHTVFAWAIYITVFLSCWKIFDGNVKAAMHTPQAHTAGESVLGTNVNVASSLIMAGLILAAVATMTAVALPKLLSSLMLITGNPFGGLDGFGYDFVNALVPIPLLLSSIGVVTTFRIVTDSGGWVCEGIIKALVGA
jgi:hypothetical protein